jgi:transposase InsO family protein
MCVVTNGSLILSDLFTECILSDFHGLHKVFVMFFIHPPHILHTFQKLNLHLGSPKAPLGVEGKLRRMKGEMFKMKVRAMTKKQQLIYGARIRLGWFMEAERLGSVAAACRQLGVPRRTYYYWNKRWLLGRKTLKSLMDEPKTPNSHPRDPDAETVSLVIQLRLGMGYGENNLSNILLRDYDVKLSHKGVNAILKRVGLLEPRKRRQRAASRADNYPYAPGEVMQLDVKHWKTNGFQYDIIDCCTRIKFKYIFEDRNVNTTVKFLQMALKFYEPAFRLQLVQMDNGSEFTNNWVRKGQTKENRMALPERWLIAHGIEFRHIPPSSPHLNGRIERSHGVDKWRYQKMTTGSHRLQELKDFCVEDCLDYNTYRPHSRLNDMTPLEFLQSLAGFEDATINTSVLYV